MIFFPNHILYPILKMNPIFPLLITTMIDLNIVPLYDCVNVNEYQMLQCKRNKIIPFKKLQNGEIDNGYKNRQSSKLQTIIDHYQSMENNIISKEKKQHLSLNAIKSESEKLAKQKEKSQQSNLYEKRPKPEKIAKPKTILEAIWKGIQKAMEYNCKIEEKTTNYINSSSDYINILHSYYKQSYSFDAYAPENFFNLRSLYNVAKDFENSFKNDFLVEKTDVKNSDNKLYSYYTNDNKFKIQIISVDEQQVLQSILTEYFVHFCENPSSSLSKFSGLYRMSYNYNQYYIVVKPSVYPNQLQDDKNQEYILKGINGKCDVNEKLGLWDNSFVNKYINGLRVVPTSNYENVIRNLKKDCDLLEKLNLTNYHLKLMIITLSKNQVLHKNANFRVYYEISNVLQNRDFLKNNMREIKFVCLLSDVSVILNQTAYKNKFLEFMSRNVFASSKEKEQESKLSEKNLKPEKIIKPKTLLEAIQKGIHKATEYSYKSKENTTNYMSSKSDYINILHSDNKQIYSFDAYAPENFSNLRSLYNVSNNFENSFKNVLLVEKPDPQKSGTKLYYTHDDKFTIQFVSVDEQQVLQSILSEYFAHFCVNPKSSLSKISGLYRMLYNYNQYYFVVKPNMYPKQSQNDNNREYILKGVNGRCDINEKLGLWDKSFVNKHRSPFRVVSTSSGESVINNLEKDCDLLEKLNLTNYHLELATIVQPGNKVVQKEQKYKVYYEISNVLQKRDFLKSNIRKIKFVCPLSDISTILNQTTYKKKFLEFITEHVFAPSKDNK